MSQFSNRTSSQKGGISPLEWYQKFVQNRVRGGSQKVTVVLSSGQNADIPRADACLVLTNLEEQFQERAGNVKGNAPQVVGTPSLQLRSLHEMFKFFFCLDVTLKFPNMTPGCGRKWTFIPLALLDDPKNNVDQDVLFLDNAKWFISCSKGGIEHDQHHVGNMFICALKSLVWTLVTEEKLEDQMKWFDHCVLLIQTAQSYFQAYPKSFEVIEPLREQTEVNDVLIRSMAFVFFAEKWTTDQLLEIVEIMLKRYAKTHHSDIDFSKHPLTGLVACLYIVPLLHGILKDSMTVQDATQQLNSKLLGLFKVIVENKSVEDRNLNILTHLLLNSDLRSVFVSNLDRVAQLMDFTMDLGNLLRLMDFASLGWIKSCEPPFKWKSEGYLVSGKPIGSITKLKVAQADEKCQSYCLISSSIPEWCAFAFLTPGTYRLTPQIIGGASRAVGNTLGEVNIANVRFTTGYDVLPKDREGQAASGKHFRRKRIGYGFEYVDTTQSLNLSDPIEVVVFKDHRFEIREMSQLFYSGTCSEGNPLVMGFKFVKFTLTYALPRPLDPQDEGWIDVGTRTSAAAAPTKEGTNVLTDNNLTAQALINQLAELKLAESRQ